MVTTTIAISMDIEPLSVDQNLCGHQNSMQEETTMHTITIGITRQSCHYCLEYGHIPQNYIRTHFKGNYNRWLNKTTCFICLKTGHVSKNYPTKVKAPKIEVNKGKEKVDVENIKADMKKTWQKRDGSISSNGGGHFTQEVK